MISAIFIELRNLSLAEANVATCIDYVLFLRVSAGGKGEEERSAIFESAGTYSRWFATRIERFRAWESVECVSRRGNSFFPSIYFRAKVALFLQVLCAREYDRKLLRSLSWKVCSRQKLHHTPHCSALRDVLIM